MITGAVQAVTNDCLACAVNSSSATRQGEAQFIAAAGFEKRALPAPRAGLTMSWEKQLLLDFHGKSSLDLTDAQNCQRRIQGPRRGRPSR